MKQNLHAVYINLPRAEFYEILMADRNSGDFLPKSEKTG